VTSDTIEGDLTMRNGQTTMHNVEIINCSQAMTEKAALRFEGAAGGHSHVSNSSIHHGLSWGSSMIASANVLLQNNIIFRHTPFGIVVQRAKNITLQGNFVSHIGERDLGPTEKFTDRRAGISICAHEFEKDKCPDMHLIGNIVAGASYAGFIVPGHECGKSAS
jgi:parallel beta-helix repeat protein